MTDILRTNHESGTIFVKISCNSKRTFKVFAHDAQHVNSYYVRRTVEVDGEREIFLSFPISPENLLLGVEDAFDPNANDFAVDIREEPLRKYMIAMDQDTIDFVELAENFATACGYNLPGAKGTVSKKGKFQISYVPQIKDAKGNVIGTPARVGHNTGNIDVSAAAFVKYTIPMRIMILLHEFSHKYKNPKYNFDISNEFGADIFGLYIYLGLGFSKIDAIVVFNKVFLNADTKQNRVRSQKINEYVAQFEAERYAKVDRLVF